jgi:hypothetical protein
VCFIYCEFWSMYQFSSILIQYVWCTILKKSLVNRRAHCIFLLWRIWLVELGMVAYCRRFALHPPDACYPTPAQMIVTYGYVGASLRCPRAPMICSVSVGGAHDFLTDTCHSEVPGSLVLMSKISLIPSNYIEISNKDH